MTRRLLLPALLALLAASTSSASFGKVPATLVHNGRLFYNGNPIDGSVSLTFSFVDASKGSVIWSEGPSDVTCADGFFSVLLGAEPSNALPQEALLAAGDTLELAVTVSDPQKGEIPLSPQLEVTSVPFAMFAGRIACTGCIEPSALSQPFAVGDNNGKAIDVNCAGQCIDTTELVDKNVTKEKMFGCDTAGEVLYTVDAEHTLACSTNILSLDAAGVVATPLLVAEGGLSVPTANASLGGRLSVTGTTTLAGALFANAAVTVGSSLADLITVNGRLTTAAAATPLTIGGNATAADNRNLLVNGNLTILAGKILVANGGTSTTTLTASNNATITGVLSASGGTSTTTLAASSNATVGGTLVVTGATTLAGALTASSSASIGGTLGVTGATTLTGALAANGGISTTTLSTSGVVGVGTASFGGHMLDVVSTKGSAGNDAIRATYSGGGLLTGTEFAALGNRGGVWTALYAKQGAAAGAAYFDGDVGIGTASPGAPLEIGARSTSLFSGWHESIRLDDAAHAAIHFPAGGLMYGFHSNGNFYWANTAGTGSYAMVLNKNGNLSVSGSASGTSFLVGDGRTAMSQGSGTSLNIGTLYGNVAIGPQNTGWAHFETDMPAFYFNKEVAVDGDLAAYGASKAITGFAKITAAGGSSTNWATVNLGGTLSINANGSIYSYSEICTGNNSGSCQSTGGVVLHPSGQVDANSNGGSGGYISTGGYAGTGQAAFFPQGMYSIGPTNWIYGEVVVTAGASGMSVYTCPDKCSGQSCTIPFLGNSCPRCTCVGQLTTQSTCMDNSGTATDCTALH
jgi:hypothetical protein